MGNIFSRQQSESSLGKRRAESHEEENDSKRARYQPKEPDAGITAYVNPSLPGFRGIIKYRIEDFVVHEVDLNGKVVTLQSLEPTIIEEKKRKIADEMDVLDDAGFDTEVAKLFNEEFAKQLRKVIQEGSEDKSLIASTETTKDTRFQFYKLLDRHILHDNRPLALCKDGVLTVRWATNVEEKARDVPPNYKALGGEYLQFHVFKLGIESSRAINLISKYGNIKGSRIGVAGTKDARAITVQTMTSPKARYQQLLLAKDQLQQHNIYIGDYDYVPNGLTLGDLNGNRFTIILRDVSGGTEEEISESMDSLRDRGFINYFGMQRFGTGTIMTHEIGRAILKLDFEEACNLILKPRPGERKDFADAREFWQKTKDPKETVQKFPGRNGPEKAILNSYVRAPEKHQRAIQSLPRNMLSMYMHAYQSYVWNHVVSERVKRFGCDKPLVGDLVLVPENKEANTSTLNNNAGRRNYLERKKAKVLTEEDLESYTIEDVVYPVPGHRSQYPENEMGKIYHELLQEKDGIKFTRKESIMKDLGGDYRPLLAKAEDLTYSFIRYNDPETSLCNSDLDRINLKPEPQSIEGK
ncbi:pseudouridine synthase [Phascolomyces articulosus]|uniref:Pseudouridine synthase n=1 Tax=Phascolomyces articulosus TaxID=60185 RepID=A0AAD5K2M8_9FUNG|nr:pseudouridine synthase [Phascolomyces articulosus]